MGRIHSLPALGLEWPLSTAFPDFPLTSRKCLGTLQECLLNFRTYTFFFVRVHFKSPIK